MGARPAAAAGRRGRRSGGVRARVPSTRRWSRPSGATAHFRVGRTEAVFEALAPACIEQVVTGKEAFRAWRLLVREFGEPAPGPASDPDSAAYGMYLPPTPEAWARVPSWRFLAAGVEQRRSRTLVRTAVRAAALERTLTGSYAAGGPGAAELSRGRRRGPRPRSGSGRTATRTPGASATTTSAKDITYVLTGEVLDDDACTEMLEPYRGHRFRVQALLGMVGRRRPRRAPRMTLPTHTPYATGGKS